MHALVVTSHPLPRSLTQSVARTLGEGLVERGHSMEFVDLTAEGFDPRFTAADIAVLNEGGEPPADALAEQVRLDRADMLVLVYPVYWWSMPALLKGWIDRVFVSGWAYKERADGRIEKKLGRLPVHLVALGGADLRTYARRGYFGAMKLQIDQGIFGYCGAPVLTSELLVPGEANTPAEHFERAKTIAAQIDERSRAHRHQG